MVIPATFVIKLTFMYPGSIIDTTMLSYIVVRAGHGCCWGHRALYPTEQLPLVLFVYPARLARLQTHLASSLITMFWQ
jgi:hypothetical protein